MRTKIFSLIFALAISSFAVIRNWSASAGQTDMNAAANYDGSGAILETDTVLFNGTSVVNATATADLSCARMVVDSAYTGAWSMATYKLTCAGGFRDDGKTGAHTYGTRIQCNGASDTLHVGSVINSLTATTCTLGFGGTTGMLLENNKVAVYKNIVLVGAAKLAFKFGASATFKSAGNIITMGDGAVLSNNSTSGALYLNSNGNATLFSFAGTYTINGTGVAWNVRPNASGDTIFVPAFTYTGSAYWVFQQQHTSNTVCKLTGNVNLGAVVCQVLNDYSNKITFDMGTSNLTCGIFRNGAVNNVTQVTKWGSGSHSIASYDGTTTNPTYTAGGTIDSFQTAQITCSGNWSFGGNHTVVPGASQVTFSGTSSIANNNKFFYDVVINSASGTITLADSMQCHSKTRTAGKFKDAGNNIRLSGDLAINGTDSVVATGRRTFTAATASCSYGSNNTAVAASGVTFAFNGNGTLHFGKRAISRLICTSGKTYTWTAGDSVGITNHTAGNWNGATWVSSTPGTQYKIFAPSGVVVTNMRVTDCYNYGTIIDAKSASNVNGGNNIGWAWFVGGISGPYRSGVYRNGVFNNDPFRNGAYR